MMMMVWCGGHVCTCRGICVYAGVCACVYVIVLFNCFKTDKRASTLSA